MKTIKLDATTTFTLIVMLFATLWMSNGVYIFACGLTFGLLFLFTQQPYKPGVFAVILIHHMLQIVTAVFLANYLGQDLNQRAIYTSVALLESLVCMVFLYLPIILQHRKLPDLDRIQLTEYAFKFNTEKTFYLYLIAFFVTSTLSAVAFSYNNITQIIISLIKIKWFFFLLFGYQCILKRQMTVVFVVFILFEFINGFFSYFSDFKTVIYYLIALLVSLIATINFKNLIVAMLLGVFLVSVGLFWESVKGDYRNFLNGGTNTQSVNQSKDDAYNKLLDLSNNIDNNRLNSSTVSFLNRIQYIFHFAKAIEVVPDRIPYQNGNNWMEDFTYATTPRFLNPDKKVLDNSVKASMYTGIRYLGSEKGVSFSLGYFAEAYIDFGLFWMPLFIMFIGFVYAQIFRYINKATSNNPIFNYAVLGSFFMEFYAYEMDGTFLSGRLFASFLTYFILIKFLFPVILDTIIEKKKASAI